MNKMNNKHIISVTGTALVDVTYNYEITDIEAFQNFVKEYSSELHNFNDLWRVGILTYNCNFIELIDIDTEVREDQSYLEIDGSTETVDNIIKENKLDQLEEWYG